jgi:ribosomal protein S18 acetylase RimI-like enzyme
MTAELDVTLAGRRQPPEFWAQIARLHQQEIQDGFLTSLGEPFLRRLYAAVCASPAVLLAVAQSRSDGALRGFLCATTDSRRALRRCLWPAGPALAFALLPRALSALPRLRETARHARGGGPASASLPRAEILNFCVQRGCQGQGMGRRLFQLAMGELAARGVSRVKIVTGASQMSAQRFYTAAGARHWGEYRLHAASGSHIYIYETSA